VNSVVDDGDARPPGIERIADGNRMAVDFDASAIGQNRAGEDLDECAFAGAILAHERQHFAAPQRQIDVAQRLHARIALVNAVHLEHRFISL
jgi:hypothetical protein